MLLGDQTVFFSSKSSIVSLDHNGLTHVNMFSKRDSERTTRLVAFSQVSAVNHSLLTLTGTSDDD